LEARKPEGFHRSRQAPDCRQSAGVELNCAKVTDSWVNTWQVPTESRLRIQSIPPPNPLLCESPQKMPGHVRVLVGQRHFSVSDARNCSCLGNLGPLRACSVEPVILHYTP
jgi:hypothetical protein